MAARLAMRTYDCRSRTPRFLASRVSPLNRGVQKLRIGWEGDVLGLHGGIDRDPRQILRPQRPALVRHPQALGQEKFQFAAEALAPMAQVRALVRKLVLEELLSGEVLEVWIIDPAFAHCFVGRIAPSDATTESCFSIRGNRENEIASFQGLRHGNLAISSQQSRQKTTPTQWVRSSSRATMYLRYCDNSHWLRQNVPAETVRV